MDPVSLVFGIVGTAVSAMGSMQQAEAASNAAQYQAQVARNNQITADQNARYSIDAGAAASQARDFKNRNLAGSILAAQAASGIDLDSTTSREVRESADQVGRLDTATIMSNAMLQARGMQAQASNFEGEARMQDAAASNASRAGPIGAFSSLLSGASGFADKWSKYQNAGVPGYGSWSAR